MSRNNTDKRIDNALKEIGDRERAEETEEAILGFLTSKTTWVLFAGLLVAWFVLGKLKLITSRTAVKELGTEGIPKNNRPAGWNT